MKKISTLFKKNPEDLSLVTTELDPKNTWVYDEGVLATQKFDGTACAMIGRSFYKRYDAKINSKYVFAALSVGNVVCKKSGKPFKCGILTDEIMEIMEICVNPQSPTKAMGGKLKNSDTIVDLGQLRSLDVPKEAYKGVPENAIPCQSPDPITGHWPHWVPCNRYDPADQYFFKALDNNKKPLEEGTYELIGPKIQGNPENVDNYILVKHGSITFDIKDFSYEGLKTFLEKENIEGIVFHHHMMVLILTTKTL